MTCAAVWFDIIWQYWITAKIRDAAQFGSFWKFGRADLEQMPVVARRPPGQARRVWNRVRGW
jgi:hypothetical protein